MYPKHTLTWSFLGLAAPVTVLAQSLESVLLENDLTRFASVLSGNPVLQYGSDLIIYAPTDASLADDDTIPGLLVRADGDSNVWSNYQIASLSALKPPPKPSQNNTSSTANPTNSAAPTASVGPARLLVRQDGGGADTESDQCGIVRETWLQDPAFVNLGGGHNQTIVEKNICGMSRPLVFSGLGASVRVTADDIPFDRGVVRPVSGLVYLSPPYLMSCPFHLTL